MITRPLFCRTGSKWLMSENIVQYFPPHLIYVEPFIGGGSIYWRKDPSPAEVINDLDKDLINDYKMIKRAPLSGYIENLDSVSKLKKFYSKTPITIQDKLTKAIIARCSGFSGQFVKKTNRIYKEGNPYSKLKNIEAYKKRIAHTIILNESYEKVIYDYDTDETLFYLDPPYEDSKGLYDNYIIDYNMMADILKNIKGKFILSINGSPHIYELFKNYKIIELDIKTYGTTNIGTRPRIELLIMNF